MESENNSVRRVSVEEVPPSPRLRTIPLSTPQNPSPLPLQTSSTLEVIVAAFTGLGYALSARALLLLSLIGAFVIALRAMDNLTPMSLAGLAIYALFTVIPVAYLEVRRRS